MQVKEKKTFLAKLETTDMGKPIQEAEWDMVHITCAASCSELHIEIVTVHTA